MLIVLYLLAISLANLLVYLAGAAGPWVSLVCAFFLVGLDMSIKDNLQERWGIGWRLFLLIAGGGLLSFFLPGSARICQASVLAFSVSTLLDVAVLRLLRKTPHRFVVSNLISGLCDSALFLWFGLGVFGLPVLFQTAAKVSGAALFGVLLARRLAPRL